MAKIVVRGWRDGMKGNEKKDESEETKKERDEKLNTNIIPQIICQLTALTIKPLSWRGKGVNVLL